MIVEELRTLPPPKLEAATTLIHRLATAPAPAPEALRIFRQLQQEAGMTAEKPMRGKPRWRRHVDQASRSQVFVKIVALDFGVLEDLVEQARAQSLSGVNRNNCRAAIGMAEEVMTSLRADAEKPCSLKCSDSLPPRDSPQTAHTNSP